ALDDVKLRIAGIAGLAVGKLAPPGRVVELPFPDDPPGLARGLPSLRRDARLLDYFLRRLRVLLEELSELLVDGRFHDRLHLARHQLALGLRIEARIRVLDADDGGKPFADVLSLEATLYFLEEALAGSVAIEHLGER